VNGTRNKHAARCSAARRGAARRGGVFRRSTDLSFDGASRPHPPWHAAYHHTIAAAASRLISADRL